MPLCDNICNTIYKPMDCFDVEAVLRIDARVISESSDIVEFTVTVEMSEISPPIKDVTSGSWLIVEQKYTTKL